ncbi:hypothetical protein BJ138DRAFT_1071932 [Hygrophoropsis aurantiaca]|uniref:Uncharacterized protein n=1 Tax=Hygrophoropsis aurantiaca TaxID=72124 RepID=A0ACB7ZZW8_9AGAM|nr:hypothetical protein BJ138DRAFT_1071932 [Hygrophoropsis aurantiaca]
MPSFSGPVRILFAVFAGASLVSAQNSSLPANCDRSTVVHLGETCDIISATFNVSTYQLAAVNTGIIDAGCDNLAVGEPLCLGLTGQDCNTTYVIQSGDTCQTIASGAGIPVNTLLTNNPNVNPICSNIYPNEVLCTSAQIYVNLTATE